MLQRYVKKIKKSGLNMLKKRKIGIFPAPFRENPLPVTFF